MSYQIYYDRAYIRVGDKFIPLVNSGSNNCFEYGIHGRYKCEKNWNVQNWQRSGQFIFTETEIREIARDYDQYNQECGMMFKSRNRCFGKGEMERWLINGMKRAYTVEEYVSFGNGFYLLDYSASESGQWKRYPLKTTGELLRLLDEHGGARHLELKLDDNREVFRPKSDVAPRKRRSAATLSEYYVLKGSIDDREVYFAGLNRKGGFKYIPYFSASSVKPFLSETEARRYLRQYGDRMLNQYGFTPEHIVRAA